MWMAAVGRKDWEPNEYSWLCSEHFISGCKSNDPLSPDYIPTIFAHTKSPVKRKAAVDLERFERTAEMKKKKRDNAEKLSAAQSLMELYDTGNGSEYCEPHTGVYTMTDLSNEDIERKMEELEDVKLQCTRLTDKNKVLTDTCTKLQCELEEFKEENECLRSTIDVQSKLINKPSGVDQYYSQAALKDQDEKVKYLTGLPNYSYMMQVFYLVFPQQETIDTPRYSLTLFQQFLLVLMKLRLNLGDQDLGYRFGIHQSTVSRCLTRVINIMYVRLKPLVKWPQREELMATMPMDFRKHFRKCVIIIDCFEVFCDRPTNALARAQVWSNYKHHSTVKFLIGIAPQGAVTFISKGWGGRVSDVYLTENCGLLNNLSNGDVILADRGFTIQQSAGLYCGEVKLPPFTKGKPQLAKCEVDFARQLSRVRIHVERVIGLIRQKYTILESTVPITSIMTDPKIKDSLSTLDKIVCICCALCNCCPSVVSFD